MSEQVDDFWPVWFRSVENDFSHGSVFMSYFYSSLVNRGFKLRICLLIFDPSEGSMQESIVEICVK